MHQNQKKKEKLENLKSAFKIWLHFEISNNSTKSEKSNEFQKSK